VIEQTIRQQLPPGFQRSEFLLEHGMVDLVVERKDLKSTLHRTLRWFERGTDPSRRTGGLAAMDDDEQLPATD
jgi:acetyl-CoA carboxylase beta subunit